MSMSNYTAQALMNSFFGKTSNFGALASAPSLFLALYSVTPSDASAGTELANANGYARVSTVAGDWNAATLADPSVVDNAVLKAFPTVVTSDWATANGFGITDSGTHGAGNLLWWGALTTPRTATVGETPEFAIGALILNLD